MLKFNCKLEETAEYSFQKKTIFNIFLALLKEPSFLAMLNQAIFFCVLIYSDFVLSKSFFLKGKSIWSLAVDELSESIVTGGGDAGIRLWPTSRMLGNQACKYYQHP